MEIENKVLLLFKCNNVIINLINTKFDKNIEIRKKDALYTDVK